MGDELYRYLKPYYEQGVDAVIVQDYGVMRLIHTCFPDLPLHISTQMSVANACGAEELKRLGAARIVQLFFRKIFRISAGGNP